MQSSVRKFKYSIVESRFASPIAVVLVLAMRTGLYLFLGVPQSDVADTGFLWKYLSGFFADPFYSFVFSTLAVFAIAGLFANMNNRFTLFRNRTNLPFIVPLFLLSVHPYFLAFSPDYISIIFIICALFPLLSSYQQYEPENFAFKSAILVAFASLFQIYALLLIPLFWRGEFLMRGVHFRSFLASVLGFLLVYWTLFSVFFFFDRWDEFIAPFLYFADFSLPEIPVLTPLEWGATAFVFIFLISYMIASRRFLMRDKVLTQITMQFVVSIVGVLFVLAIVYWEHCSFMLILGLSLISLPIANIYTSTLSKWTVVSFYSVFVLGLLFYFINYFSFFSRLL